MNFVYYLLGGVVGYFVFTLFGLYMPIYWGGEAVYSTMYFGLTLLVGLIISAMIKNHSKFGDFILGFSAQLLGIAALFQGRFIAWLLGFNEWIYLIIACLIGFIITFYFLDWLIKKVVGLYHFITN